MKEIAKDVYHISVMPLDSINVYLIEDYLIDAGIRSSFDIIYKSIKGREVNAHVLTHAHADHQGSSKAICQTLEIPFWCSEAEKSIAEKGDATREYKSQNHVVTKFQRHFWVGEGYPVSKTLKENDKLGDFRVIETPGHSSGQISFFRESDGVLILGDVMVNMNFFTTLEGLYQPPELFTLDKEQNIKSIKKLASLNPRVLCFGHGSILKDQEKFQAFAKKL